MTTTRHQPTKADVLAAARRRWPDDLPPRITECVISAPPWSCWVLWRGVIEAESADTLAELLAKIEERT